MSVTPLQPRRDGWSDAEEDFARSQQAEDAEDVECPPSWEAADLTVYAMGEFFAPRPTLMPRTDGQCLLYPGLVHSMHGESESGKSWVAQCEIARILKSGGRAGYIDFESDAQSVVGRLLELGCSPRQIIGGLTYRRPEAGPNASPAETIAWNAMMADPRDVIVIDGVTDSLGLWGATSTDNDEVATWLRQFPRRLATRTGAAIVLIDHVTKNSESRGRFAIGAQTKMAGLDGAAYTVEVLEPLGRGLRGVLSIRIAKDRPGGVRGIAGEMKKSDRTQEVAHFVLDGTGEHLASSLLVPDEGGRRMFRPTILMEKISAYVEASPGASKHAIESDIAGKATTIREALGLLVGEGFIERIKVGVTSQHMSIKPYLPSDDPFGDGTRSSSLTGLVGSRPLVPSKEEGTRGRGPEARPGRGRDEVGRGDEVSQNQDKLDISAGANTRQPEMGGYANGQTSSLIMGRGGTRSESRAKTPLCQCPNGQYNEHRNDCEGAR